MDCFETKRKIVLWLDELLEPEEAGALEAHLAGCSLCREEENRVERLFGLARSLPAAAPSPAVWQRICAALPEPQPVSWTERVGEAWERWKEDTRRFLPSYAAGAASAALFLLVFFPPRPAARPGESPLRPVSDSGPVSNAGLDPTAGLWPDAFPVRQLGARGASPGKQLVLYDGQLWEVDAPPARPAVQFPVKEIGMPAAVRIEDF